MQQPTFFHQKINQDPYPACFLADAVSWVMPEGHFSGHEGFRDWYAIARRTFKPGCRHRVEQSEITPEAKCYRIQLRVRLNTETFDASGFKGATLNMLVNESWWLTVDSEGDIQILDYQVQPL